MSGLLFDGDKGGVGKSITANGFVDFAHTHGIPVLPIDADTRNPDMHRMFSDTIEVVRINLRTENGWADMVDLMDKRGKTTNLVVNMPAGIGDEEERYATNFAEAAKQIGIPIVQFWVINRGVDSVNQLRHQLEQGLGQNSQRMICLRNQHFAPAGEKFDIWNDSKTRQMFEERGGVTADFPALSERVVTQLDKINTGFSTAIPTFSTWDRITLQRWLDTNAELFNALKLPLVRVELDRVAA